MYFVKKLMKLRVRCCLLHGRGAHETSPARESVVVSRMVCCLHAHLSVSESITLELPEWPLADKLAHFMAYGWIMLWFGFIYRPEEVSPPRLEFGPLGMTLELLQGQVAIDRRKYWMRASTPWAFLRLAVGLHKTFVALYGRSV